MKIEHMTVYAKDIERIREFYRRYFGAVSNDRYHNQTTGFYSYFLTFEDGARLEIMHRPKMREQKKTKYDSGYIHIAFSVGGKENVDSLTNRIETDGYTVISPPRVTGDGYYESLVCDPEGNYIEIVE